MSYKITIKGLIERDFDCKFPSNGIEGIVAGYFASDTYAPFDGACVSDIKMMFEIMSKSGDYSVADMRLFSPGESMRIKRLLKDVPSMKCVYLTFVKAAVTIFERDGVKLKAISIGTGLMPANSSAGWYESSISANYDDLDNGLCSARKEPLYSNDMFDLFYLARHEKSYEVFPLRNRKSPVNVSVNGSLLQIPSKFWKVEWDSTKVIDGLREHVLKDILSNSLWNRFDLEECFHLECPPVAPDQYGYFVYGVYFMGGSYFRFRTTEVGFDLFSILRGRLIESIPGCLNGPVCLTTHN